MAERGRPRPRIGGQAARAPGGTLSPRGRDWGAFNPAGDYLGMSSGSFRRHSEEPRGIAAEDCSPRFLLDGQCAKALEH